MAAVPARWKFLIALWTVYLVWGSTYFAIKISVRTLPAFLSAGSRFLLAGGLLALILVATGRSIRVTRGELGSAAVVGTALLALGVGVVTLAETRIDSSTAAMIAGSVPLQVILLRTLARERVALATRLSSSSAWRGSRWSSFPAARAPRARSGSRSCSAPASPGRSARSSATGCRSRSDGFVATTWEMLSAGVVLLVLGAARGELGSADPAAFSLESILAWLYLGIFGTLVAFTAYTWLLRNAPISKVVTHQYVNPIVAIALGALLLEEEITLAVGLGAALIVGSVFVAVRHERGPAPDALPAARPTGGAEAAETPAPRKAR